MIVDIRLLQGKLIQDPEQHGSIADLNIEQRLEQLFDSLVEEDEDLKVVGGGNA